jgi:hypothetical protein
MHRKEVRTAGCVTIYVPHMKTRKYVSTHSVAISDLCHFAVASFDVGTKGSPVARGTPRGGGHMYPFWFSI